MSNYGNYGQPYAPMPPTLSPVPEKSNTGWWVALGLVLIIALLLVLRNNIADMLRGDTSKNSEIVPPPLPPSVVAPPVQNPVVVVEPPSKKTLQEICGVNPDALFSSLPNQRECVEALWKATGCTTSNYPAADLYVNTGKTVGVVAADVTQYHINALNGATYNGTDYSAVCGVTPQTLLQACGTDDLKYKFADVDSSKRLGCAQRLWADNCSASGYNYPLDESHGWLQWAAAVGLNLQQMKDDASAYQYLTKTAEEDTTRSNYFINCYARP